MYDAVIVGAGPNGLSAGVRLVREGYSVAIFEAEPAIGGGARTAELTLPEFQHDICSAIHPLAKISPFFKSLPLEKFGLEWIDPPLALAHPFDDQPAAALAQSIDRTAEYLGSDSNAYRKLIKSFAKNGSMIFDEVLRPLRMPRHPFALASFGWCAMKSAWNVAHEFQTDRARSLFLGCGAHSLIPLDRSPSASFAFVMILAAHLVNWPLPKGGSQNISDALAGYLRSLGGEIFTGQRVTSIRQLPQSRTILFDVTPKQLAAIASDQLPAWYAKQLRDFRYGPGVFKVDWALSEPIPWNDPLCKQAGSVHLGCTSQELIASESAVAKGQHPPKPFVLLAQQSLFDPTRAPQGKHTGWAYCHVPNSSTRDMTDAIESQVERFASGFRKTILARKTHSPAELELHNANLIGGDITGGSNHLLQLIARPTFKWDPYSTPNHRIFLCSSSTPPGGGVHGMCGYHAAASAIRRLRRSKT